MLLPLPSCFYSGSLDFSLGNQRKEHRGAEGLVFQFDKISIRKHLNFAKPIHRSENKIKIPSVWLEWAEPNLQN